MRILCTIPDMGAGGAQRVMSYLARHLASRHDVSIVTWEVPAAGSFYALPQNVGLRALDRLGGRGLSRLRRVTSRPGLLRREIRAFRPDAVVSFMDTMNITALAACQGLAVPVIVSERNDTSRRRIGRAKEVLRDWSYRKASAIVVQTERIKAHFPSSLHNHIRLIANPVPRSLQQAEPDKPGSNGRKRMVGVGRLEPQKGFERLIQAFALRAPDHPDWDLVIFGEGIMRPLLTQLIQSLGVVGRVTLPGLVQDIGAELGRSHLMVFPSDYEGFPNALAEALSAGLPAIGNRDVSGVEDMIVPGETGLLVQRMGGVAELAAAMGDLMSDDECRATMGRAARDHMRQWAPERILATWEALIEEAVAKSARGRQ